LRVFYGTIEEYFADEGTGAFEIVTCLNVLEHLRDPLTALRTLRSVLTEDGIVAIVVPDASLQASIGKVRSVLGYADPYWLNSEDHVMSGFKVPDHLTSFTKCSIVRLLETAGFRVRRIAPSPVIVNPGQLRTLLKRGTYAASRAAAALSGGRWIPGYSLLVIAEVKR
jgi:2-polyprenyl-3-methyl-5-hydroxy-6-metoxy-1,4-benzoquinol methylase